MALPRNWVLGLAGHDEAGARALARDSRAAERAELERDLHADERRLVAYMDAVARESHVVIGTTETGVPYRIALSELAHVPGWLTGSTGSGKSRVLGVLMAGVLAAIVRGEPLALILDDGKGETADLLLRTVARLAEQLPARRRDALLARLYHFAYFAPRFLPSWPLLDPIPGIPIDVQASAIADVLMDAVGDATVGARQRSTLAAILAIAVEFRIPLVALPWLLARPEEVASLAARSSLPLIRLELARFPREPQGSIDGLRARLATLLRPSLKAVLSGTQPFDFAACYEPGAISIFNHGEADLGDRFAVRGIAGLTITALANSAFDPRRTVRGRTLFVVDELPAIATPIVLAQLERLGSRGRSFGAAGTLLAHQGSTQLAPAFQAVLATNSALRILGRSAERDSRAATEYFPKTGRVPRPPEPGRRASGFLSESEEERFRIAQIGRLPPRSFLVSDPRCDFQPRIIRAAEYDPPPWSAISPDIAEAVQRGANGVPRSTLEARVREIEERAAAELGRNPGVPGPTGGRRRARSPQTPDVVGGRRRGKRGEVP